ncbi:MAG: efflux transporter outer membrane subunit [Planctomycetes bacterium]|nr:efflux transporter outer membrane subunit [Planctomycetota bacterium]
MIAGTAIFLAAGCMVGPDFEAPKTTEEKTWAGLSPAVTDAALTNKPVAGEADISQWWTNFNDPILTSLIERADADNQTLASAEARIRAARARRAIAIGGLFPVVDAFGTAAHSPNFTSTTQPYSPGTDLFAAGFDASWELDIFGRIRRRIESTEAELNAAIYEMRDVRVTLAAEVATSYSLLRTAQEQLRILRSNLATQDDALKLTTKLYEAGITGLLDVSNARAQVEQTRSRIPIFESLVRESIYTLDVLIGKDPRTLLAELEPSGPMLTVPKEIPVGLPSDLLKRRPDIRRAESQLHAATARIGIAVADQFPTVSLTGALGTQSTNGYNMVSLATTYWSVGANATWTIFDGGRLQANVLLQKALTDAAIADYRQQVLVAFRDVEVALVNFSQEQSRRDSLRHSTEAFTEAVSLATELYKAGRTDFLNVLAAQRSMLDTQEALAQSERAIADDLIALYKALGGGWGKDSSNDSATEEAPLQITANSPKN